MQLKIILAIRKYFFIRGEKIMYVVDKESLVRYMINKYSSSFANGW